MISVLSDRWGEQAAGGGGQQGTKAQNRYRKCLSFPIRCLAGARWEGQVEALMKQALNAYHKIIRS